MIAGTKLVACTMHQNVQQKFFPARIFLRVMFLEFTELKDAMTSSFCNTTNAVAVMSENRF